MSNVTVVYKKTRYEIHQGQEDPEERRRMEEMNGGLPEMKRAHDAHHHSLDTVITCLSHENIPYRALLRADADSLNGSDLVVAVGGDGTILDASHHILTGIPILGVNSDPGSSLGYYAHCYADAFLEAIRNIAALPRTRVHRLKVVEDGIVLPTPVLNELFISHEVPAASTWFTVTTPDGKEELYKNRYKLFIATAGGSTGAIFNYLGELLPMDSPLMQYISDGNLGELPKTAFEIKVHSRTHRGKIYIDGYHVVYDFNHGKEIIVTSDGPLLTIIGDFTEKRKAYALKRRQKLEQLRDYINTQLND